MKRCLKIIPSESQISGNATAEYQWVWVTWVVPQPSSCPRSVWQGEVKALKAVFLDSLWGSEGPKGSSHRGSLVASSLHPGFPAFGAARASAGEIRHIWPRLWLPQLQTESWGRGAEPKGGNGDNPWGRARETLFYIGIPILSPVWDDQETRVKASAALLYFIREHLQKVLTFYCLL